MSEYHSFSLSEYLPTTKSTKKSIFQQDHEQNTLNTLDLQAINEFVSTNRSLDHDSTNKDSLHPNKNEDWLNQHTFQSLDSILNMPNPNHTRHHSLPESMSNYHQIYEFLPFEDSSQDMILSNSYNSSNSHNINDIHFNDNDIHHSNGSSSAIYNSSLNFISHVTANSPNSISGLNDHENTVFPSSHNGTDNIIAYLDTMDQQLHESTENKQMNSHLVADLSSKTTSTPSPSINQTSIPAYGNSNLSSVQTPSILEFPASTPSRISSSVSSRSMQGIFNASKMQPAIKMYLQANDPIQAGERTVIIMTSKVAQKSYGTEKRFLCPPPTTILVGSSWWTPPTSKQLNGDSKQPETLFRDKDNVLRAPPSLTICISGESSSQQIGRVDWYGMQGTLLGQAGGTNSPKTIQPPAQKTRNTKTPNSSANTFMMTSESKSNANDDWYRNPNDEVLAGGRCVSKRLFINDADEKRKKVECLIKVQLANGLMLGTLSSRGIKVISKPSKKRQSVKNVELCIYHGTTVSLFNRIRSQTVSTKYLGVSSTSGESPIFDYPGRLQAQNSEPPSSDTCFVARAGSWDPFIVWLVDPNHNDLPDSPQASKRAEEYIGCPSLVPTIPYPNPPTIALKNRTSQPLAIRYNQHIVLQCLTTGLVSPVMIIRKVDKASTVLGGARCPQQIDSSFSGGGEFGDEVLGDPVSQLHKIALQIVSHENIMKHESQNTSQFQHTYDGTNAQFNLAPSQNNTMMPQKTQEPSTYLACLNDLVGTHKATDKRLPIKGLRFNTEAAIAAAAAAAECYSFTASALSATLNSNTINPRKRRVSMMENSEVPHHSIMAEYNDETSNNIPNSHQSMTPQQNITIEGTHYMPAPSSSPFQDRSAAANRKSSLLANGGQALAELGAYWSEEVIDAAVWTIVGTECARYTFWTPPYLDENKQRENQTTAPLSTPFPCLTHFVISTNKQNQADVSTMMTVSGENFTRDLQIWFGDIKAPFTEYRSREMLVCRVPPREELMKSVGLNRVHDVILLTVDEDETCPQRLPYTIRILLVRGDGVVYKTSRSYSFA